MQETVNPIYTTLGDSLSNLFRVPKYQRGYAWTFEEFNEYVII